MRLPNIKMTPVKQDVIYLTGGLNESVAALQLKSGELFACSNYQEVDGPYAGYSSIKGFERYDGRTLASEVDIDLIVDKGLDSYTKLLLESQIGGVFEDLSVVPAAVTNTLVTHNSSYYKLSNSSFYFDPTASLNVSGDKIQFDSDFAFEFFIWMPDVTGTSVICEKADAFKMSVIDGKIQTEVSTTGSGYDVTLLSDSAIDGALFTHVVVKLSGTVLSVSFNGLFDSTTGSVASAIANNSNALVIGSSSFTGYLDEIRLSYGTERFLTDFTVPSKQYSLSGYYVEYVDDTAREAQRATITEVPGDDSVLGIVEYDGDLYAFRNDNTAGYAKMYKATATGWSEITQPAGDEFELSGSYRFKVYRFESFNGNQPILIIADGLSRPRLFDGTTITILTSVELPEQSGSPKYTSVVGAYDNRLYLGYAEGSVVFSDVGDPTTFSAITTLAGELFLGDALTDIIEATGNTLVLFMRGRIKILKSVAYDGTNPWAFQVENFTEKVGGIAKTAQALLDDVYFADDEGVTSLIATDTFGDFKSSILSTKVQKTFLEKKDLIVGAITDRESNQYRLYFSDGTVLYFSFDKEKKVKGTTTVSLSKTIQSVAYGESPVTGSVNKYFASTDGYVYKIDSGTSFDDDPIITQFVTSFYHYKSPRIWKNFRRMTVEANLPRGLELSFRTLFDYQEAKFPKTFFKLIISEGSSGIWGFDEWGSFNWGSSQVVREAIYLNGYGTNMAIEVRTSSKYKTPHVFNNIIIDYSLGSRRM